MLHSFWVCDNIVFVKNYHGHGKCAWYRSNGALKQDLEAAGAKIHTKTLVWDFLEEEVGGRAWGPASLQLCHLGGKGQCRGGASVLAVPLQQHPLPAGGQDEDGSARIWGWPWVGGALREPGQLCPPPGPTEQPGPRGPQGPPGPLGATRVTGATRATRASRVTRSRGWSAGGAFRDPGLLSTTAIIISHIVVSIINIHISTNLTSAIFGEIEYT